MHTNFDRENIEIGTALTEIRPEQPHAAPGTCTVSAPFRPQDTRIGPNGRAQRILREISAKPGKNMVKIRPETAENGQKPSQRAPGTRSVFASFRPQDARIGPNGHAQRILRKISAHPHMKILEIGPETAENGPKQP